MLDNAEPWLPNDGLERVSGTRFTDVRYLAETGSTNADLLAAAASGLRGPLVLVTGHQNAGRGRQDRSWFDEPGDSLLVSVLVDADPSWAGLLPLAAGVAAVNAVNSTVNGAVSQSVVPPSGGGPNPADGVVALKWPQRRSGPLGRRAKAGRNSGRIDYHGNGEPIPGHGHRSGPEPSLVIHSS